MDYLERFQQIAKSAETIPEEYAQNTKNRTAYVRHVLDGTALDEPCCGDHDRARKVLGGFTSLDLDLSDECNLSCGFCYTKGGYGKENDPVRTKRFLDWFLEQAPAGKAVKVNIFGGEPMLEWETVLLVDDWLKASGRKYGLQVVTNMTLLDDEKLQQAIERRIGISPSIDGCPEAQDYHRRFKPGTVGSSELVYENAKRLLKVRPNVRARMTISPETCSMVFRSHVFLCKEIGFRTINAILAGGIEWQDREIAILKGQFRKLTNWWINEINEGRYYDFYYLRNMFTGMFGPRKDKLCGAGTGRVAIDTDGNLWPCHRFCNQQSDPAWKLGMIDEGTTNEALRINIRDCRVSRLFKCNCIAWPSCHAHCMHELMTAKHIESQNGRLVFTPTDITCKIWPFYWREAERALEKVKEAPIFRRHWGELMDKIIKATTQAPIDEDTAESIKLDEPRQGEDEAVSISGIGEVGMELPLPPKVKDAPDDFVVSLVISARDEGEELIKTVESARVATTGRLEIVLVDDGSRQDTTKAVQKQFPDVTVVRIENPVGAGRGRNVGVAASTGRVIVLCDGHMRYPKGIFHELGKVAIERQCFVCPGVGSMHGGAQGYGTRLTWHRDIKIGNDYERAKSEGLRRVSGLLGACYFMPREIFENLGGWTAQLGIWGYEEPIIGAWAYLHDVAILTDSKWLVKHLYRSERNKGNLPVPWGGPPIEDLTINIYAGHARLFQRHTNHNIWFKADLYKRYDKSPRMVDAVKGTNMMGSDVWQRNQAHTDYEFFRDVIKRPCLPNPDGSVSRICPVSIIIMACNEGVEVENTIVSVINSCNDRHEIIVVNDASRDASFANLVERVRKRVYKHWRDFLDNRLKIITHEKQLGTAQSRRDAIAAATGEVLVFFDAHMRVPSLYGIESMACHALDKQCVLVPQIAGLNQAKDLKSRRTYGARFKVTRKWGMLNSHINQAPPERFTRRDAIIGACYVVPKTVLDRLGGWPNLPGQWAYNEQQIGIRCFLYDVPIYYDSGVIVEHFYKKTFNYPLDHGGVVLNGHRTFALHFPETYPTFWEPLIREHGNYPDIIKGYLASDVFKKEAVEVAATRKHTEREFFEKMLGIEEWPVSPERWLI